MDFRIAPLIMVFFNLLFIALVNPEINEGIALSSVANIFKILIPFLLIFLLSLGAFMRHDYYSRSFKFIFYSAQSMNILLAIYFIYTIKSQHLG